MTLTVGTKVRVTEDLIAAYEEVGDNTLEGIVGKTGVVIAEALFVEVKMDDFKPSSVPGGNYFFKRDELAVLEAHPLTKEHSSS